MIPEQFLKRKERLLIQAIRLLDESGIAGVTTKELAKREGISESAVYRHYDGKVEVLLAILNRFAEYDEVLENTVLENKMAPLEAIRYIVDTYAAYYAGYPEIASVLYSTDLWKYDKALDIRLKDILKKRHTFMKQLVQEAIAAGSLIKQQESADALTQLLSGLVGMSTLQWKMLDMRYDLKERIHQMRTLIIP